MSMSSHTAVKKERNCCSSTSQNLGHDVATDCCGADETQVCAAERLFETTEQRESRRACAEGCCTDGRDGPVIVGCDGDDKIRDDEERKGVVKTNCDQSQLVGSDKDDGACKGDYCSGGNNAFLNDRCCGKPAITQPSVESCKDACYTSTRPGKKTRVTGNCEGDCCSNQVDPVESVENGKSTYKINCQPQATANSHDKHIIAANLSAADNSQDLCCVPAKAQDSDSCCDNSCLDRLASLECENVCGGKSTSSIPSVSRVACASHKAAVRKRYSAKLNAIGCICRALLSLGEKSCCANKKSLASQKGQEKELARSSQVSVGSRRNYFRSRNCSSRSRNEVATCKDACCGSGQKVKSTIGTTKVESKEKVEDQKTGCVSTNAVSGIASTRSIDLEKGSSSKEYVVLSINGMTCTGCETKLQRVLSSIPAISNSNTSLTLSRAEFSLAVGFMSVDEVIKHIERTTEFKCERISTLPTKGSTIDVLPTGGVIQFLNQAVPHGVDSMQLMGKSAVRISSDPKVIGARDLLDTHLQERSVLAPVCDDAGLAAGSKHVRNLGYTTLLSILLTIPVLVLAWAPIKEHDIAHGAASLALASIIQVFIAGPFYPKAIKSLIFSRMIEMDLLIVLSTSAAYIFSVVSFGYIVSGNPLSTGQFFETSTLLVSLIMVGRWVSALARQKAVESISFRVLQSSTADLVNEDRASIAQIDTRLLQYGDNFQVLPEVRIPTDGIVIRGESEVDESMITGESIPIGKQIGSKVIAGSINRSGKLVLRLTHLPCENTISTIAKMVDKAKLSKPKIQALADRIAQYFVPAIVVIAALVFLVWVVIGITVRRQSGSEAAIQAITYAITVLIVSCPCAIGLAVPMVVVIASGVAAMHGVIFKSADSIEIAHKATHVIFDKTGTLTEGKLTVAEQQLDDHSGVEVLPYILGLVANSKHPVSVAITAHLLGQNIKPAPVDNISTIAGKGIEGMASGKFIRGGNALWGGVESDPRVQTLMTKGYTIFCIFIDTKLCAVFGLFDSIRPEAVSTVAMLKQRGVQVSLLSGDHEVAVQKVACSLLLDATQVRYRCSPTDKQQYIQNLTAIHPGKKLPIVIFIGDGTNDAIALAQARVGVHMSSGTDVAQSAADVVLMQSSLQSILTMMDISRGAMRRIKFNFTWAFTYNLLAILLASGALVAARGGDEV